MCFEPETTPNLKASVDLDEVLIRDDLQVCISGVQTTLEHTDEEDTRSRMKFVLKSLQRLAHHFEARRKAS